MSVCLYHTSCHKSLATLILCTIVSCVNSKTIHKQVELCVLQSTWCAARVQHTIQTVLDCFTELTILKLCMCLYLAFRVILYSLKSQNILVAVMCIQLLHVLYMYLYSHSPHNVMHSYSNYYQLISATWRWFESPLTFSRCAQHNFPLVPANIRAECHYSSIHSHLHLHWWSCHCCLLDSKQSYSH